MQRTKPRNTIKAKEMLVPVSCYVIMDVVCIVNFPMTNWTVFDKCIIISWLWKGFR